MRLALRSLLAFAALATASVTSQAQLFRAYLSPAGNDSNPCTLPSPCRMLPAALNAVASGGEIWMLDSANYNTATVTIDKSVTILAVPGAVGSIVLPVGAAAAINLNIPTGTVFLRNLRIVPLPGAQGHGIVSVGGTFPKLHVEHVEFSRLVGNSIDIDAQTDGTTDLVVNDTTFQSFGTGIRLRGNVRATLARVNVVRAPTAAVLLDATTSSSAPSVTISDSVIHCASAGLGLAIVNPAPISSLARIHVARSTVTRCGSAIWIEEPPASAAYVALSGTQVTENSVGVSIPSGGTAFTLGGNPFTGNVSNGVALTPTPAL